ncbi:MAG TPA: glycerol-3-phosphate 1-O-acyltransferase PlsY [Candidatus Sulfotelmatobacter sp.]|nr:glycerol-3-phosphate 1-O-acyltransferase PlsY [Candidatus Sulfotelmatobacter sp.]
MPGFLLIAAASYLLGSIPFGYLLVRVFRGEDVRQSGSGNIGATNVSRKSPLLGVITLLLDAGKGSAAVILAVWLTRKTGAAAPYLQMSVAALCAVLGHLFPVWLKFRGGKGVATGLGSFVVIAPKAVLIAAAVFIVLVLVFRYISLGSIVAVLAFPLLAWVLQEYGSAWPALVFMALASLLIVAKHRANIRRLLAGTENRFGAKHA